MLPLAPLLALLLGLGCGQAGQGASPRPLPPVELKGTWHRVRDGETLGALARRYRIPLEDIEEINGVGRGEPLEPGHELFIPGASPRGGQGAQKGGQGAQKASRGAQAGGFLWPLPGGKITSGFGKRGSRTHEGIDIAAPEGTAVLAAGDGVVAYSGAGIRGYGNLILIHHPGHLVTVYAHNRKNLVRERTRVRRGQVIAEVGHTGRATGPHLHFEIRKGDLPLDPTKYVKPPGP